MDEKVLLGFGFSMTSCSSSLDGINAWFSFWASVKEGHVGRMNVG
jgi:hypothetical protein